MPASKWRRCEMHRILCQDESHGVRESGSTPPLVVLSVMRGLSPVSCAVCRPTESAGGVGIRGWICCLPHGVTFPTETQMQALAGNGQDSLEIRLGRGLSGALVGP